MYRNFKAILYSSSPAVCSLPMPMQTIMGDATQKTVTVGNLILFAQKIVTDPIYHPPDK